MRGIDLIAAERERQVYEEGYDQKHDRGHADQLAQAAAVYALPERLKDPKSGSIPWLFRPYSEGAFSFVVDFVRILWPWDRKYYKPADRRRELAKAGALIAAAIDSLPEDKTNG